MVRELPAIGSGFTWYNRRQGTAAIRELLDRFLSSDAWIDLFPNMQVKHLPFLTSDHCPVRIALFGPTPISVHGKRGFRLENKWALCTGYKDVIRDSWDYGRQNGATAHSKLELCGEKLRSWGGGKIGNVDRRISATKARIETELAKEGYQCDMQSVRNAEKELEHLYSVQESHWKQRSRADWMIDGDRNTSFFHKRASNRLKCQNITGIRDSNGEWCTTAEDIAGHVFNYYEELFTSSYPSAAQIATVVEQVDVSVTEAHNQILDAPFIESDIHKALFDLHPSKSPGPDGFPASFFQQNWETIKSDIVSDILNVLNNGASLEEWNRTVITLLPKVNEPQTMKDFRPISLCNVGAKIIARAITNRLRIVLGDLIDPNQSAFVPGRLITDNVLLGFECMHWLRHTKCKTGYAALKLDMSKAYDRIEWPYLQGLMIHMGFSVSWVNLVLRCISSVSYSFKINGQVVGSCRPSRGLRQGDPLSPYLFVLCAQGLSSMITRQVRDKAMQGVAIARRCPVISHLFFADDSLVFLKVTQGGCMALRECLRHYERASGQMINFDKSSVTYSPLTPPRAKNLIRDILGFSSTQGHEVYLGLPTFSLQSKRIQFGYLRDRIAKRINAWSSRHFSDGGKEVLIKSVLQSMPTYAMGVFRIPNSICTDIEKLCNDFWWGKNATGKKIHWMSWDALCRPKSEGGLGFRKMAMFNKAMLAKQLWRIISQPQSLVSRVLKARYFKHCDVMDAVLGSNPSFVWRSLQSSKALLDYGLYSKIGNGSSTYVFKNRWIPGLHDGRPSSRLTPCSTINRFILPSAQWNEVLIRQEFLTFEAEAILQVKIGGVNTPDSLYWKFNPKGVYTVSSGYHAWYARSQLLSSQPTVSQPDFMRHWFNRIWNLKIPPKIRTFLWKFTLDIVATEGNLATHHVPVNNTCFLCRKHIATMTHALIYCKKFRHVWSRLELWDRFHSNTELDGVSLLHKITTGRTAISLDLLAVYLWGLWRTRCDIRHNKEGEEAILILLDKVRLDWAADYLQQYQRVSCKVKQRQLLPSVSNRIFVPLLPHFRVATAAHGDGRIGIGVILFSASGKVVRARFRCIVHPRKDIIADLLAIKIGTQLCVEEGLSNYYIKTESSAAVRVLQSGASPGSSASSVAAQIFAILDSASGWHIIDVHPAKNVAARQLAVVRSSTPLDWDEAAIPFWINDPASSDIIV